MTSTDAPRQGRPRDPGRDRALVGAALDELAEVGYDRMTLEAVAARAGASKATLYRRWSSKEALVLDAVASLDDGFDATRLEDTGSLRGDFEALYRQQPAAGSDALIRIMGGLSAMLSTNEHLAEAAQAAVIEPFVRTQQVLIQRAVERGEVSANLDLDLVARVSPLMTFFRLAFEKRPVDGDELMRLVDGVILPALGLTAHP